MFQDIFSQKQFGDLHFMSHKKFPFLEIIRLFIVLKYPFKDYFAGLEPF